MAARDMDQVGAHYSSRSVRDKLQPGSFQSLFRHHHHEFGHDVLTKKIPAIGGDSYRWEIHYPVFRRLRAINPISPKPIAIVA